MKSLIFGLLTSFIVNISFGQQTEKFDYCNCQDKIEQISPFLNGQFERKCNGILIEKGNFIDGLKNGEWITYSRKGKLIRKLNYTNGLLDGEVELFYVNGKPKLTGQFEKGNKIGKWVYYTEKGKILAEGSYDNNKPIDIWTINDKKGKKTMIQYDYTSNKFLVNSTAPYHKDKDIIQNENTEEWYILRSPDKKYSSKSEPLGGYSFANYMFIELVEIPEVLWDTYLYNIYKTNFKITEQNVVTFDCTLYTGSLLKNPKEITFLTYTDPASQLKKVSLSELESKLLDLKINEAINLMPPWIYNEEPEEEVYIHYVINENMHRK